MPTETETIDIYCERLDPSFWAEPINALTNLAFIAVGFWVLRGSSQSGKVLGLLTLLVGIGSLAFHTFATPWAATLDVGFIALFILAFA
ncbi:MAG: alkaline phytoceramidase, partial [Burkholderiaceae bacterium]